MSAEKIVTESALSALASDAKRAIYDILPTETASGDIASFETDLSEPLVSCKSTIAATGGNGTPSTPIPINGYTEANITRCGVNLWDEVMESGSIDNTTGQNETYGTNRMRSINYIPVIASEEYCVFNNSGISLIFYFYASDKSYLSYRFIGNNTTTLLTLPNNCSFVRFRTDNNYGTTYNNDISINYPSTDTTYHPYTGNTYTIAFGQTVYGGVLDVTRGKLTVTHGIVNLGTLAWISEESEVSGLARIPTYEIEPLGAKYNQIPLCTSFLGVLPKQYNSFNDGEIGFSNSEAFPFLRARTSLFIGKTNAEIKALMDGVMFCYELATPFDIDLTPVQIEALLGVNNVFSDTNGTTEVDYKVSVAKYVNDHSGSSATLASLTDVALSSPTSGQALKYNGSKWANADTWTDVVGTLTAGSTSITLSNAAITTSSTIQVFTDPEVPYSTLAVSSGQAVLTFDAQANDVSVKVRVT